MLLGWGKPVGTVRVRGCISINTPFLHAPKIHEREVIDRDRMNIVRMLFRTRIKLQIIKSFFAPLAVLSGPCVAKECSTFKKFRGLSDSSKSKGATQSAQGTAMLAKRLFSRIKFPSARFDL